MHLVMLKRCSVHAASLRLSFLSGQPPVGQLAAHEALPPAVSRRRQGRPRVRRTQTCSSKAAQGGGSAPGLASSMGCVVNAPSRAGWDVDWVVEGEEPVDAVVGAGAAAAVGDTERLIAAMKFCAASGAAGASLRMMSLARTSERP